MNKFWLKKQYMMYSPQKGRLPSGYQEVEYIQGDGKSYIDLGVKSRSGLTIIVDDHLMRNTSGEAIVSGGDAWDVNFLQMGLGGWTNYNSQIYKTNNYLVLTRCIYKVDDSGVYINDVLKQSWTPTSWNSTYNLFAFASNRGGTLSDFSKNERLYKLEILENGVHIRNFIPCYRKSDNEIGLFDIVGNKFYTNSGSGTFSKGADV